MTQRRVRDLRRRAYLARHRLVGLISLAVAVLGLLLAVQDALASAACMERLQTTLSSSCDPPPDPTTYVAWLLSGLGGVLLAVFWPPDRVRR